MEYTKENYRNIFSVLPEKVYWIDESGVLLDCNYNMLRFLSIDSKEDIIGKNYYDLMRLANWDHVVMKRFYDADFDVINSGLPKLNSKEIISINNNKLYHFLANRVPLKNEYNNVVGLVGSLFDVTEYETNELNLIDSNRKINRANQAKSKFLAKISHELRTPMNAILGAVQILSCNCLTPKQKEYVNSIYCSSNNLLDLINDILDLHKIESSEFEFILNSVDLMDLCGEVLKDLSEVVGEKNLKLTLDYPDDIPRYVMIDCKRVKQILFNLIENAIKYTREGSVVVSVSCLQKFSKEAKFRISIIDTGIGISSDKINLILNHFDQLDACYVSENYCVGLGLEIVNQLIKKMRGKLHVKSKLNHGTTFHVDLVFPIQNKINCLTQWPKKYSDMRVLVVTDDALYGNKLLSQIPILDGTVVNGEDAIDALVNGCKEKYLYKLVIIDFQMSFVDALELGCLINSYLPFNDPNLFLLCYDGKRLIDAARMVGFSDVLLKELPIFTILKSIVFNLDEKFSRNEKNRIKKKVSDVKVLLVEDDLFNQKISTVMLENLGCKNIDVAQDGKSAIEMSRQDYDIIFMDIGLPDLDGYVVTNTIRNKEKCLGKHVPIIAMTACAFESDKKKCFAVGMDTVIVKPIVQNQLQRVLAEWFL